MLADGEQLSLFDLFPKPIKPPRNEPEIGEYVDDHGMNICHIMRPSDVGQKVVYDCSTENHKWLRCGRLERYFLCRGVYRSVITVGKSQKILLDHINGRTIYEPLMWDEYPKRMAAIGSNAARNE